jgi:rubrerythrin
MDLTVEDILKKGIERELESQRLYKALTSRVKLPGAQYAFSLLVKQEEEHEAVLNRYLKGGLGVGALSIRQVIDYRMAEFLDQPEVLPDMGLPEIFLIAANREKKSNDFYTSLAAIHPEGETKLLLLKLASEELGHKQRVESMYSDVAFPQTDGG